MKLTAIDAAATRGNQSVSEPVDNEDDEAGHHCVSHCAQVSLTVTDGQCQSVEGCVD